MTFLEQCIQDSMPIWRQCLESEFVQGVAHGTLPEACFKGYIVDDSLYLREYSKVFAWGMLHSHDMEEIRTYYSLLSFVNESEDATRRHYLRRYGITDEEIQPLPLRPENRAYVDCMLSYAWIFGEVIRRFPQVRDSPYWPFVRDYAGDRYEAVCRTWSDFTDRACAGLSPERQKACLEIFRACSLHELRFWEMSAKPRADL